MDSINDISAWLTPAIIIGLFPWLRMNIKGAREELRADVRALEGRFEKRFHAVDMRFDRMEKCFDGMDERLRAVEAGQAEIKGQLSFTRDYILGRNLRETEDAPDD